MVTREERLAQMREYTREWHKRNKKKRREYYRKWYKENGRNRFPGYDKGIREWTKKHQKEVKTHRAVRTAVRNGTIKKPKKCEKCNRETRLEGHHEDYNKPLEVIWLCSSCHKLVEVTKVAKS